VLAHAHELFALPDDTRLFMCHDYKAPGRDEHAWETTVAEERAHNVHVHEGVSEDKFVEMREARDATLSMLRLIQPSAQVNMRRRDAAARGQRGELPQDPRERALTGGHSTQRGDESWTSER